MKWLFACLLLLFTLTSTSNPYYFRHYGNEEGLSNNTVFSCLQDSKGFVWFATKEGLNRFDGIRFKTFFHQPNDSTSLISNIGSTLEEDNDGNIWIGTNKGICYYSPEKGEFKQINDPQNNVTGLIYSIKKDSKDKIWFLSQQGIFRYSMKSQKLDFFPSYKYFKPISLCVTTSDKVWITSDNGELYSFNARTNSFDKYPILNKAEKEKSILLIKTVETRNNSLLLVTDKAGIKEFFPNNAHVTNLFKRDANGHPIYINNILQTDDKIWIASESGVHIYERNKGFINHIKNLPNRPYSLSNNAVKTIIRDKEGGIWLGTYYGGVNYLPNESTPFTKYYASESGTALKGNVVKAICKDKNGNLWVGTEDAGLNKFDADLGIFEDFTLQNKKAGVTSSNIQGLMVDDNDLWIATYDNGVFIFDLNKEKVKQHFDTSNKNSEKVRTYYALSFTKTKKGTIYVGTTIGIFQYDPEKGRLDYKSNLAPQTTVQALHEDQQGNLWIGTLGSGLFIYDQQKDTIKHFNYDPINYKGLGSDFITSIFEDNNNQIWLTTEGNGFCKVNKEDGTFTTYNSENGIFNGITCGILEDGKGNMWISSTNGLIKFNSDNMEKTIYTKLNGLTTNHFSINSTYKDNTGQLYFGTVNGMISFNPIEFNKQEYKSSIFITALQTSATSKHPTQSICEPNKSILYSKKVRLAPYQSSFNIDFAAPSFTSPALTKYRYKLNGSDKDWHYLNSNRTAYYTNIAPGKYTFIVAATNDENNWQNNETRLDIVIKAPLWRSKVALTFYFMVLISILITFLLIYRRKKKLETQHKIYQIERAKDQELLNSKLEFFTNITHEVRTPLTLIKAPLDSILSNGNCSEPVKENLTIMKNNADRLLNLTNQLLDFRKTENERLKLNFKAIDIVNFIEKTCNRFLPLTQNNEIEFSLFKTNEEIMLVADEEALTKIISNLLTNAIKYTHNVIQIYIEDIPEKNLFRFRINSNGKIIPQELHVKIFEPFFIIGSSTRISQGTGLGLPLSRTLAKLHHGKLYLDDSVIQYNSFVLELPLKEEEEKLPQSRDIQLPEINRDIAQLSNKVFDQTKPLILIVEDEREMRHFLAKELSYKYNILTAGNGEEALEVLKDNFINLIVSDILMPVFNGYQLCRAIKSDLNFSHIPIIMLTASTTLNARIEGLECGADAYLEKPFSNELLIAQIDNIIHNKEIANKNFINRPFTHHKTIAVNKMDEDFLKQLHSYIVKHMAESTLTVELLANEMKMSVSTLYRKVKAITDLNTNEYIRFYRLKKSAELLVSQEYRINEVAYLVGFSSASYFSTSFQKQFGISPTHFIKQHQAEVKN